MSRVVAILCSDIHLSHSAPACRADEPNWYDAMARGLDELSNLQKEYQCPVIFAGDLFDRWQSPPELINFAMNHLPDRFYAIPGQHDLPNHSMDMIHRSAYQTLVEAGKITNLSRSTIQDSLAIYPFPWGREVSPIEGKSSNFIHLAVVHAFIWKKRSGYDPEDKSLWKWKDRLKGFDVAVFGDNHQWFYHEFTEGDKNLRILNCGTFFRRKSDEIDCRPKVGLLKTDKSIQFHFMDIESDKIAKTSDSSSRDKDRSSSFIEELRSLGEDSLDFRKAVNLAISDVDGRVREMVLEAVDGERISSRRNGNSRKESIDSKDGRE